MTDRTVMEQPACDEGDPLKFVIGRNSAGFWVVVERHGLYGGIFVSQRAAAQFAKFESAGRRSLIAICAGPLELYDGARSAA
jgi:hypothetical protein